jgi:hypothetical protein
VSAGSDRLQEDLKVEMLTGAARVLGEEAVRIKSRLDQLDGWIRGTAKGWYVLGDLLDGEVSLVINAPLGEARQQVLALRAVLESLAKLQSAEPAAPVASKADDLKAKRDRRRATGTAALSAVDGA